MPASPIDRLPEAAHAGGRVFANKMFHLGPGSFDWIEVGAVGWKEQNGGAGVFDELADLLVLVGVEVVHANDMAWPQDWDELPLHKATKLS